MRRLLAIAIICAGLGFATPVLFAIQEASPSNCGGCGGTGTTDECVGGGLQR